MARGRTPRPARRYLAPNAEYGLCLNAKEVQIVRLQLDSGAISLNLFHPAKRAVTDVLADPGLFRRFTLFVEAGPADLGDGEPWLLRERKDSRSTTSDSAFDLDEFGAPRRRKASRDREAADVLRTMKHVVSFLARYEAGN